MIGWQLDHNMQTICTSLQTDNHASTSPLRVYKYLYTPRWFVPDDWLRGTTLEPRPHAHYLGHAQWRSSTFGRLVRWSNLPPYCLRFWKMNSLFKAARTVLMSKVTCIYSIPVSS